MRIKLHIAASIQVTAVQRLEVDKYPDNIQDYCAVLDSTAAAWCLHKNRIVHKFIFWRYLCCLPAAGCKKQTKTEYDRIEELNHCVRRAINFVFIQVWHLNSFFRRKNKVVNRGGDSKSPKSIWTSPSQLQQKPNRDQASVCSDSPFMQFFSIMFSFVLFAGCYFPIHPTSTFALSLLCLVCPQNSIQSVVKVGTAE